MPLTPTEYVRDPAFNPGVLDLHAFQAQKWVYSMSVNPAPVSPSVTLIPAIPGLASRPPEIDHYQTQAAVKFLLGERPSYDWPRQPQQELWDALGHITLQTLPATATIYGELCARGGGAVTPDLWSDFRQSSMFDGATESLGLTITGHLKGAEGLLAKAIRRAGPGALRRTKSLVKLLELPTTPEGAALWLVKLVGEDLALTYAKKGLRSLNRYFERNPQLFRPAYPANLPVMTATNYYEPYAGLRPVYGPQVARLEGVSQKSVEDFEYVAYGLVEAQEEDSPFLVPSQDVSGFPPSLMNVGGGEFR